MDQGLSDVVAALETWHKNRVMMVKSTLGRRQAARTLSMRQSCDRQLYLLTAERDQAERALGAAYALFGPRTPPGTAPDDSSAS